MTTLRFGLKTINIRVRWHLLPRAAARIAAMGGALAGWAWVLPFVSAGWMVGVMIKAVRAAIAGMRLGYRRGDRR